MFSLRKYQTRIAKDACQILQMKKIVCLFCEVRTGKTVMALQTCKNYDAKKVLFITKLKAISSIKDDYKNFGYTFELTTINRESLHKIDTNDFDVVIIDEVHGYSSYPKPSKYHKDVKQRFGDIPMILLSGTPTPESHSQWYHIFSLSNNSPFKDYKNFYKWAEKYVDIELKQLGYAQIKDYSKARKIDFWHHIRYYILTFTQIEAGFETQVNENILYCDMDHITYKIIDKLKADRVVENKEGQVILADTGVKLQQKIHQLCSGTCKFEDGSSKVIDLSKAIYIKNHFKDDKIAIFYKFVEELNALKNIYGNRLTTDLDEFNATDKCIALQYQSGKEGISLKNAKYLVAYNIDFSSSTYWQFRARMATIDRPLNDLYWIFGKEGIESKIYASVIKKKSYTTELFERDYGLNKKQNVRTADTNENNNTTSKRRLARFKNH